MIRLEDTATGRAFAVRTLLLAGTGFKFSPSGDRLTVNHLGSPVLFELSPQIQWHRVPVIWALPGGILAGTEDGSIPLRPLGLIASEGFRDGCIGTLSTPMNQFFSPGAITPERATVTDMGDARARLELHTPAEPIPWGIDTASAAGWPSVITADDHWINPFDNPDAYDKFPPMLGPIRAFGANRRIYPGPTRAVETNQGPIPGWPFAPLAGWTSTPNLGCSGTSPDPADGSASRLRINAGQNLAAAFRTAPLSPFNRDVDTGWGLVGSASEAYLTVLKAFIPVGESLRSFYGATRLNLTVTATRPNTIGGTWYSSGTFGGSRPFRVSWGWDTGNPSAYTQAIAGGGTSLSQLDLTGDNDLSALIDQIAPVAPDPIATRIWIAIAPDPMLWDANPMIPEKVLPTSEVWYDDASSTPVRITEVLLAIR